jgi:hypothetical protein
MSLSDWLDDMQGALLASNVDAANYFPIVRAKLTEVGRAVLNAMPAGDRATWAGIRTALEQALVPPTSADLAVEAIYSRTQGSSESLRDFAINLRALFARAHPQMANDERERLIFVHFMRHIASPMKERLELLQPANLADAITKGERYANRINEDHQHNLNLGEKLATMAKRLEAVELMRLNPPRPPIVYTAPPQFPQNNAPRFVNKPNNTPICFYCKKPGHYKTNCPMLGQFTKFLERFSAEETNDNDNNPEVDPDFLRESVEY